MPDLSKKTSEELLDQALELTTAVTGGGKDRAEAAQEFQEIIKELRSRPDAETELKYVKRWMRERARIPDTPASSPREPQHKKGAAGGEAALPGLGFDLPSEYKYRTHYKDQYARLKAARCKLCAHLRRRPRPGGSKTREQADWASDKDDLLRDMILAEEQLLLDWAVGNVGYSDADHDVLGDAYRELGDIDDELKKIEKNDPRIADLRGRLNFLRDVHEGLLDGISEIDKSKAKKVSGDAKKVSDGASRALNQRGVDKFLKAAEDAGKKYGRSEVAGRVMKQAQKFAKVGTSKVLDAVGAAAKRANPAGAFGKAIGGGAAGMFRMLHQETERLLIEIENDTHASTAATKRARDAFVEQKGKVQERRMDAALEHMNDLLEDEGKPPLRLHRMATKSDDATKLDASLAELHGGDRVDRVHGDKAAERLRFGAAAGFGRFRRKHGVPFDDTAAQLLLEWCRKNCAEREPTKVGLAPRTKTFIAAGGTVVAIVAAALALTIGGDSRGESVSQPAAEEQPAEDAQEPVDDPVPADEEEVADAAPGPATRITVAIVCDRIGHFPLEQYPDSPSHFGRDVLAAGVDGTIADGTALTLDMGADASAEAVLTDGMGSALLPISSMRTYDAVSASAEGPDGRPIEVVGEVPAVTVGPEEGPVGGCVAPQELPADEREAAIASALAAVGAGDGGGGPAPDDGLAVFRAFLTDYEAAHRRGDVDWLLEALDPAVIDLYGADQCRGYLSGVAGSISDLELVDGRQEPWEWSVDGRTTEIADAWTIQMQATVQDAERQSFEFHLHEDDDGVSWFTDCGDPT